MFKSVLTLVRGRSADAAEDFMDANALPLLRQQIRDAGLVVAKSRQAVAVAMAGQQQEAKRYEKLAAQAKDLETRAVAALDNGANDMAQEAAEAIAYLEDEKASSEKAQQRYEVEIGRLRNDVRTAQVRLRDLERGQRLAAATNQTQKLQRASPSATNNSLNDAEKTLERLEQRQDHLNLTRKAEAEIEQSMTPAEIAKRLAGAGHGKPVQTSADAVLQRLQQKQSGSGKEAAKKTAQK